LVDWYIAGNSQGLFAACLSSEIFHLTPDERLAVVRRTLARAKGRLPVIAAAAFPTDVSLQSAVSSTAAITAAVQRVADTGVEAVILLTNQFVTDQEGDEVWLRSAEALLDRLDHRIRLGLYECPIPYKRVLSPNLIAWAAQTGRFDFIKDTCCDLAQIKAKIAATAGTSLRFYNAQTATLLPSLQSGGHGFSGVGANTLPHLYAWLCQNFAAEPALAGELQVFLTASYFALSSHYPHSTKTYLGLHGLPITPVSRVAGNQILAKDITVLHALHADVIQWEQRLGLQSPFSP
ncbi:MAG: dihydrodipicolinate synthase family protein, partial [Cephaloticoccus sp.]|nr:dihydrodipicolinate synthase family protein [Cephaloticoccus sp.]